MMNYIVCMIKIIITLLQNIFQQRADIILIVTHVKVEDEQ